MKSDVAEEEPSGVHQHSGMSTENSGMTPKSPPPAREDSQLSKGLTPNHGWGKGSIIKYFRTALYLKRLEPKQIRKENLGAVIILRAEENATTTKLCS